MCCVYFAENDIHVCCYFAYAFFYAKSMMHPANSLRMINHTGSLLPYTAKLPNSYIFLNFQNKLTFLSSILIRIDIICG